MNYLALSAVTALVISCQSESHTPPPTPSTSLASIHVDVPGPISEILPELTPTRKSVSSFEASKIELESGVVITIPEHSFVYENGSPVTEHVELIIEDMTSLGAILKSGIRMDAKMPNGEYGTFQTAGMISIKPVQSVKIAPGKSIGISFPTKNMDEDFTLWKLNEQTNEWEARESNLRVNQTISPPASTTNGMPSNSSSFIGRNASMDFYISYEDRLDPEMIEYLQSISVMRRGWKVPRAVPFDGSNPLQSLQHFRTRDLSTTPELASVSPIHFVALDSSNKARLDQMNVSKISVERSEGDYYILRSRSKVDDSVLYAKVRWSYTPQQANKRLPAYNAYALTIFRADSTMISFEDFIDQENFDIEIREERYREIKEKCEWYISCTPSAEQRVRRKYLINLLRIRANNKTRIEELADEIRRSRQRDQVLSNTISKLSSTRDIEISSFGIYNCDRFWSVPSSNFAVNLKLNSSQTAMTVYLIDVQDRAIVNLGYRWIGRQQDLEIQTNRNFVIMAMDGEKVFVGKLNSNEFSIEAVNDVKLVDTVNDAEIEQFLSDLG